MTYARATFDRLPPLASWIITGGADTPEAVAFRSGAALAHLHLVLTEAALPQNLLRARLALRAAEACAALQGRVDRAGDLRDAVAFLHPGASPGPAGEICLSWRRAVERPVTARAMHRALPELDPAQIATWRDAEGGAPVARAAATLAAVLADRPHDPASGMILAEAALAEALGWSHLTPLLAAGLKPGDLRKTGADLQLACHRAIIAGAGAATRAAADLTRRAARLRAVAPKLRAKGAEAAVMQFLTRDAVAPTSLTSLRSDRAARRLCDRLVALGAVRELTGRDTFRLYGV